MTLPFAPLRRVLFLFLSITAASLLLSLDQSMGADNMVVAVDSSTLLKAIGLVILGLLGEIWRNQRALFRITKGQGEELKDLKGYCRGKNCGPGETRISL